MFNREKILLHACCAPCSGYVYQLLSSDFDVSIYFYNPNIAPFSEYERRLAELKKFSAVQNFELITADEDLASWNSAVEKYTSLGEGSRRCEECIRHRLDSAFRLASEKGFGSVATTLSVSPHKNVDMINKVGAELSADFGISFIAEDFKKNNGYQKSVEISRKYSFYRQTYCGCVYSIMEKKSRKNNKDIAS